MKETDEDKGFEIVNSRVFDEPREKVFGAFKDPAKLAKWWGPAGFTNTVDELDFRVGGDYRITMHGPDGKDYYNRSEFLEIVEPERIVFFHHETMHQFRMTMIYEDLGGKTKLTWRQYFVSSPDNLKFKEFLNQANEQNFDRLNAVLKGKTPA